MKNIITKGKYFVDEYGKKIFFHGINVCYKGHNDFMFDKKKSHMWTDRIYFDRMLSLEQMELLESMGINLIRLGITWDAIEPRMGEYNDENIECIRRFIRDAGKCNIYVLLDMHQDLYAGFGNDFGDGAPRWATLTNGVEHRYPKLVWAEGYAFDEAVSNAFDNFWANTEVAGRGLQDRYADMWAYLVGALRDEDNLFGYDIMNEPFAGTKGRQMLGMIFKNLRHTMFHDKSFKWSKFLSGLFPFLYRNLFDAFTGEVLSNTTKCIDDMMVRFDEEYYNPFLERVARAIRGITPRGIFTIDNNYLSNLGVKMGIKPIEYDGVREPLQCFAPHCYDFMVDTIFYNYASNDRVDTIFDAHRAKWAELDMPIIVGEWGCMCYSGRGWHEHIKHIYDYFDRYEMSNIYWQYDVSLYATYNSYIHMRPYCMEILGDIISQSYDYNSNTYTIHCALREDNDNLVIALPLAPIEMDGEGVIVEQINSPSRIKSITDNFRKDIKPTTKWLRWYKRNLLEYDFSESLGACRLHYSLVAGEHTITIKMARSRTQKTKFSRKDMEFSRK